MKRLTLAIFTLCLLAGQAWGATKTVCSSGCDYATATDALESNAQSAGTIIEFQADTPGGSKTWTEDAILIHSSTHGSGDADATRVIIRGRAGDTITLAANAGQTCAVRAQYGAQNYVTFQNLTFSGGTAAAFDARLNTGLVWTNCTFTSTATNAVGMYFNGAQTSFSMTGCSITGNAGKGMYVSAASTGTITNTSFTLNGNYGMDGILGGITYTGCTWAYNKNHGFDNNGVSSGTTVITQSSAHDNCSDYPTCASGNRRHGFTFANGMSNVTLSRSYAYNSDLALDIQATTGSNDAITVYSNILIGTGRGQTENGAGVFLGASDASYANTNVLLYNNTIISEDASGEALYVGHYNDDTTIAKNNIIYNSASGKALRTDANLVGNITMDYNLFYSDNATAFNDKGTTRNFSAWKTSSSQDANSQFGNPLLDSSYVPAVNSPALWQRASLGGVYDFDYNGLFFGHRGAPIGALSQGVPRSHNVLNIK